MDSMRLPKVIAVLGLGMLAGGLAGCPDEPQGASCGNGLLGVGEQCDCGDDPQNLPSGCSSVNGAPGADCSAVCTWVVVEDCDNNVDDDGDEAVDCDDEDCLQHPRCLPESVCNDRLDNDADGLMDCDDPDCADLMVCIPEICTGGVDENDDGFTDCQDAQCLGVPECEGVEVCWGGVDDDGDGYTDCDDEDCLGQSVCDPEDCDNGVDDDGDFKVDCADRSCIESADCTETGCDAAQINQSVTLAQVSGMQVVRVGMDISAESDDNYGQCDVTNGKEFVLEIELQDPGRLRIVFAQTGAHRFGLYFKGGADADCAEAMNACTVPSVNVGGVLEYGALPSSEYYLIVSEDTQGSGGAVDLVLTLVEPNPANAAELCDNLLDDDENGQYDCGDLACYNAAGECDQAGCVDPDHPPLPDEDIGALDASAFPMFPMPGAVPALLEINTEGGGADFPVTGCQGLFGDDQMIHFTLDEPAMIQVGFKQNMADAGDHVLALFFSGDGCALAEHECIDTGGIQDGVVTFPGDPGNGGHYPAGDYYLVTKAMAGSAGRIDLQILTFDSVEEICHDQGFDNDGDGDTNCVDADCVTHHLCLPEDCSDQDPSTGDLDGDGRVGCQDMDPDDGCSCSYACACYGQSNCDPADHVCDGEYDDEVIDLGEVVSGSSYPFNIDTSAPGARADYDMENCHGTLDSTQVDMVLYFTLTTQADIGFHFTQPSGVDHAGMLMRSDRCRACDDLGPGTSYLIYCYYTQSPWLQNNLPPGSYALVLKAVFNLDATEILTGPFSGNLVIDP